MDTLTGEVVTLVSVKVMPSTTLASVLSVVSTAMPLMLALAFAADCVIVVPVAAGGSKARRDRPVASVFVVSSSVTLTRKPFAAPVVLDCNASREPEASVTMVALTPALAALILSRMPASVFSVAPIGTTMSAVPGLAVKLAWPVLQVPRLIVSEPVPTTSSVVLNWPLALTVLCVDDSAVTVTA